MSRKDEIFVSESGFITIAGCKLTGFRRMAEKVVDLVGTRITQEGGRSFPRCSTNRITINGGEHPSKGSYAEWKLDMLQTGVRLRVTESTIREWIDLYGMNALKLAERFAELNRDELSPPIREPRAQLAYAIECEMSVTAVDFVRLLTGWSYFQPAKRRSFSSMCLK